MEASPSPSIRYYQLLLAFKEGNLDKPLEEMASISRSIVKKVLAIEQAEVGLKLAPLSLRLSDIGQGAGARVRRSIGTAGLRNLTPFLGYVIIKLSVRC